MSEPSSALELALSDRYRFERELGVGGMATVYLAHDLRHGRALYLRGAPERPVTYLRVIPNWVSKMEHAVDDANPGTGRWPGWIDRRRK
ncbi:MAG TPA: hypothetical protein VF461_02120 [Gemmatimonadaceae bacterium]